MFLDNIIIKTKNDSIGKSIEFTHNTNFNERLNLEKVKNNYNLSEYSFQYNDFSSLPHFMSRAQDHWGYYKGTDMNISDNLTDAYFNLYYSSREPNTQFSSIGTLKKIIYPTKGWTEFTYEPHSYSKYIKEDLSLINEENMAGGVRISSTVNNDGNGNIVTKNYKYTSERNSNTSSGILNLKNLYFYPEWKVNTLYEHYNAVHASGYYHEKNFTINTLLPQINFSGSHVGYSKVYEYDSRGTTEYNFTDFADYPDLPFNTTLSKEHSIFENRTNNDFLRGKEKLRVVYDTQGNPLSKITNTYSKIGEYNTFNARSNAYEGQIVCPGAVPGCVDLNRHVFGSTYFLPYYDFKITNQIQEDYFGANKVVLNKSYEFYNDSENQFTLLKKESTNINSDILSNEYKYASNLTGTIYSEMMNNFLTDIPISIQKNKNNHVINKIEYIYDKTSLTSNKIQLTKLLSYDINSGISSLESSYNVYDNVGNLLEHKTKDSTPTTFLWGYNQSRVIAKIEGATYSEIMQAFQLNPNDNSSYLAMDIIKKSNLDRNETTENDLLSALQNFKTKTELQNFHITTYTYDPLAGVKTVIFPSGMKEQYKYDLANRLEKILDKDSKIMKEYKYNFAPTKHYNSIQSRTFTRNNCGANYIGGTYTYTVPANTYFSYLSQLDADQKAIDDINANGQNTANLNAICIPILPCSFRFSSVIGTPAFSNNVTYSITDTVNFDVVFSGYGINQSWANGVNIGIVGPDCIPSVNREIIYMETSSLANRQWKINIDTAGNCTVKLLSGLVNSTSYSPLVFQFQYQK